MDLPGDAGRLHPGSRVHGVAPEVEENPTLADDTADDTAARHAHANLEVEPIRLSPRGDLDEDRLPERDRRLGMVGPSLGRPAAAIYASPTVLIFSMRCAAATVSKRLNRSSSSDTTSAGSVRCAHGVNPTMSMKMTVVAG
jgi:hypothetical protein